MAAFRAATAAARSVCRSAALRNAAAKPASVGRTAPQPSFSGSKTVFPAPSPQRFFRRSPVEMSCAVESLLPFHSVTASALMKSMLADSCRSDCWMAKAGGDDV